MNVAYNSALRQSKAIRTQLSTIQPNASSSTPAEIGNVAASLASFSKSVDEYSRLVQNEPACKKQEEARERLGRFRDDLADFRGQVDALKRAREDAAHQANRSELLGRRPYVTSTPENPYNDTAVHQRQQHQQAHQPPLSFGSADEQRETHALREQQFLSGTHSALDEYIARGQAVLGNLGEQREMMKSTQKRLYSVANTLGVSGDTIRMVERRAREDKWIFGVGVLVFFLFCWMCLRYLR